VTRLQPDAAASLGTHTSRGHLRVVGAPRPAPPQADHVPSTERTLLDAWREAHWSLRVRMREIALDADALDVEALYDAARRADNNLTHFYQARAEVLTRRLRDALRAPAGAAADASCPPLAFADAEEQTLLRHFRGLGLEDRASLLRLASRLDTTTTEPPDF
jgi:hypothetical protein